MDEPAAPQCIAFEGTHCIASGDLTAVVLKAKEAVDRGATAAVLIFDLNTSDRIDVDLQGSPGEVEARLARAVRLPVVADAAQPSAPRGPGRPKLGVVAREITLLPRHWDWLNRQPGGASVALRRLVEDARKMSGGKDRVRESQEAAYRFMSALAGDMPGFEEATRALFAGDAARFEMMTAPWPTDVRDHARRLAGPGLASRPSGA